MKKYVLLGVAMLMMMNVAYAQGGIDATGRGEVVIRHSECLTVTKTMSSQWKIAGDITDVKRMTFVYKNSDDNSRWYCIKDEMPYIPYSQGANTLQLVLWGCHQFIPSEQGDETCYPSGTFPSCDIRSKSDYSLEVQCAHACDTCIEFVEWSFPFVVQVEFAEQPTTTTTTSIYCTADVRQCPDGSYVSRDPANNCEFKPCPNNYMLVVIGGVALGYVIWRYKK